MVLITVTPVQALAFHRIAGWVGLWFSILHGFLHLHHLANVLFQHNPEREHYTLLGKLKYLIVPESWHCFAAQNPLPWHTVTEESKDLSDDDGQQCWLSFVNATGVTSCIAYILLAITSLPGFRRRLYTIFYIVHVSQ